MGRAFYLFSLTVMSALFAAAQQVPRSDKDYTLSVDVQLVQLPVSVLDKDGVPVSGLSKRDFRVFEDGVLQEISLFKHEDVPLSLGLVIDNSGSMHNKRTRVNSAALTFVGESNPEDETFIVNFNNEAYLEQDFTSSIGDLFVALKNLDTRGETALYDALYLSAEHLKDGRKDKKALLLISDGEDNSSKYGFGKALEKLRSSKATVYAIGLLDENDNRGRLFKKPPSNKAKEVLERFAVSTGGRAYFPKSLGQVEEICKRIARDLRSQYTVGYNPTNRKLDGSWRNVTVRVNPPKNVPRITATTKDGYYAPVLGASVEK
jgi:Ca-activated chloride channel family protein